MKPAILIPAALFTAVAAASLAAVLLYPPAELPRTSAVTATMGCPSRINELIFTHSGFTRLDLSRPELISK